MLPKKLQEKIANRIAAHSLRELGAPKGLTDFSSNDYLGYGVSEPIKLEAEALVASQHHVMHGATGSRLLTGNHSLFKECEAVVAAFHHVEAALIFNSGYSANIGFFQCVPQREDLIFYDEYIHASIRDGISLSHAKAYKFKHNDLEDLKEKCRTAQHRNSDRTEIYIVTESVFSMDGDTPDLELLATWCAENKFHLIVDEAHAVGVFGTHGGGLIQQLGLEKMVFARVVTFGKALGCHGAAILGSEVLKRYLINFARSFIYTTALPPLSVATIIVTYRALLSSNDRQQQLHSNIAILQNELIKYSLNAQFISSDSAIHCCKIPGNQQVRSVASKLQKSGFDVRPILSPTVPVGSERLRICLHSYNNESEIASLIQQLESHVT